MKSNLNIYMKSDCILGWSRLAVLMEMGFFQQNRKFGSDIIYKSFKSIFQAEKIAKNFDKSES